LETPGPSNCTSTKTRRRRKTKFVGRQILHKWCVDKASNKFSWYDGNVLECVEGKDGQDGAVYEVKYKLEKDVYLVDHLQEDFDSGSLKFNDI